MKCNTISVFFFALITISTVHCAKNCCPKNAYRRTSEKCDDGTAIIIPKCAGYQTTLNNEWSFMTNYIIRNDSLGEYLDDYVGEFIVRSPNFCLADMKRSYNGRISPVAVICSSNRIHYKELKTEIDESDNSEYYFSYWGTYYTLANFLSMLFLAIAFYIYYLVIPTRQIEDNCLLHFAGCSCLAHAASLYGALNSQGLLPDMCITHLYLTYFFVLCRFTWYALFMYCLWKKCKSGLMPDDNAIQRKLRMIGYGGPAFIIILANIHAHSSKLYAEFSFEQDCIVHAIVMEDIYIYSPEMLAIGLNCFFWRDLAKHIETTAVKTSEDELNKKKIISLLTLNRRLFIVFGLPWLLYVIVLGMIQLFDMYTLFTFSFLIGYLTTIFGVFISLILVMSRARVWNSITLKYKNIQLLKKWHPSDEETSVESDNDSYVSKTLPSEV